jgi:hypothetical protein
VIGLTSARASVEKRIMRALCAALLAIALAPAPARAGTTPGFEAPNGCTNPSLAALSTRGFPRVLPLTLLCPFEPRTDCIETTAPGGAKLLLKQVNEDRTRDRVRWRLTRGAASLPADLGDPTAGTAYELCVYVEVAGVCTLVVHPDGLPGTGWRKRKNGFEFLAPPGQVNPNGVRRIRLRTGAAGRSQVLLRGKGDLLGLEALPMPADAAVLVQLHNGADRCWSAEFGAGPIEQTERRFNDLSD